MNYSSAVAEVQARNAANAAGVTLDNGNGGSNGYTGGTVIEAAKLTPAKLAEMRAMGYVAQAQRENQAKQYLSQTMPSINFGEMRAEAKAPSAPAANEKTQEKAKARYDAASAQYETQSKQLDKLLAQMGDYAGYGADLEKAKTSTADAKAKMEEAADAYRALGGTIEQKDNSQVGESVLGAKWANNQRVGKTIAGGAENYLASLLGTVGSYHEGGVRGSKAQIERDLADLQTQADKAQQTYDEMLAKYGDENNVNVKAAASALAEIKSNQELYQGMLDNQSLERTSQAIYGASDRMAERGAQNIAEAKEGLGAGGQFLVDTGAAGVQLLGDIALGKVTGLGMMPIMGARSYGGGANEARQAGATYEQQFLAGGATAAVEMLTEKLADGLAGVAGKGAADDVAKEIIRKWAKTDAGRTALRAVYGISGEAGEEAISTLVSPLIERIYNDKALKESYGTAEGRKQLLNEALHDALVGGALGGFGTLGSLANGQNAAELADMRMRDASMGDVQSQTNNAFDVLFGRMSPEQAQAREAAALARLNVNEQAAPAPAVQEAPAPVAQETTGQDALLEAAGITPVAQEAVPAPAAPVEQTAPEAVSLENRQAQIQQRLDEISAELDNPNIDDARADELMAEGETLYAEKNTVEQQIKARNTQQERIDSGDVSKRFGEPENHIDNRTNAQVQNPSVKAFQYDHPELHQHFVEAAQALANLVQSAQTVDTAVRNRKTDSKYYENKRNRYADTVRSLVELGLTKPEILQCCQDIIDNNGAENYSKAKKVELVLNDMLTNGYTTADGIVEPNAEYIAAKEAITGAKAKPAADSWEAYLERNELALSLGEVTEGQLRAEWEAQQAEAATEELTPAPAPAPAQEAQPAQARQTTGPFSAPEGLNTKSTEREGAFSSNTLNQAEAAAGVPDEARSRFTYETKSEGQSVAEAASRLETDRSGEVQRLVEAEAWSGTQTDMAAQIANELYEAGDLQAYADWKKIMNDHAIETGRGTQAWAKYSRKDGQSAFEAVTDSVNEAEDISPEQKAQILQNAKEAADSYDAVIKDVAEAKAAARESGEKAKAPDSLLQLIRDISGKRNTGTIFEGNLNKLLDAQKGNVDYLTDLAYNQIIAMSNDYTVKRTFAEKVKTFQTLAQLTSVATFGRNILGNVSFGAVDTLTKDGFGVALDAAISKLTGKRTVALDKSWFSGKARKGAVDAMQKSALEIALDVDMSDGKTNKYGQSAGRTFKAANGGVDAFFSRWEQLLNYSLTTSDKFSRGALEAENRRGLDALENSNLTEEEKAAIAEQEADYRLFQNKGSAYKLSKGAHDVLNVIGFGGKMEGVGRNGGFGLGDIVNTYPGVPANLGVKALEYSPANIVKGGIELMNVLSDAKNGKLDATKQYQAVMDISRGLAGVPIIALFSSIVKAGLLKNWDDEEDKDVKAQNAAEGKSGIQLNVDAIKRWLNGERAEWKNGDHLESVGFLEPINAFMAIGSLVASQEDDATLADYAKAYANGTIQSFLDIPVMSNISNMVDTYRYSSGEGEAEKIAEAALNYAGNSVSGFIPSPIRAAAKAGDKYYRDTSGENVIESTVNSLKSSIPGLRETLPVKLDNYGNPKEYYGSTADRIFDAFVNPGSRNELRQSEESAFAMGLQSETGISGVVPSRKAPNKLTIGDEKVELTPDEKRLYQETAGSQAEKYIGEMMQDELFKSLSPEEQASVIKELNATARQQAVDAIKAGRNAEGEASDYQKLIEGVNNPGEPNDIPGLDEKNVGQYVLFDTAFKGALKRGDYSRVDKLVEDLTSLDGNTQEVLAAKSKNGGDSTLNHLAEVAGLGVGAESYFKYKEGQKEAQEILDKTANTGGDVKMLALANADIPEEEKVALLGSEAVDISKNRKSAYDVLSDYGYTVKDVYEFFEDADWSYNTKTGEYEPNNKLEPLEVASAIRNMGLSRSESSALFDAFSAAFITSGNPNYDKWVDKRGKPWSYDSEIRYLDKTGYQYTKTNAPNYLASAAGLG